MSGYISDYFSNSTTRNGDNISRDAINDYNRQKAKQARRLEAYKKKRRAQLEKAAEQKLRVSAMQYAEDKAKAGDDPALLDAAEQRFNKAQRQYLIDMSPTDEQLAEGFSEPSQDNQNDKDNTAGNVVKNITNLAAGLSAWAANERNSAAKDPMGRSAHLRRQAKLHDIQSAEHRTESQKNKQIANRNYRGEAEKNAVSSAASQNAQTVANQGNVSAGAAALNRTVGTADYNTHMQRSDEQRKLGVENMEKSYDEKQLAQQERAAANVYDYTIADMNRYNTQSDMLSHGAYGTDTGGNDSNENKVQQAQQTHTQNVETTGPVESTERNNDTVSPQDVLNYLYMANDPGKRDTWGNPSNHLTAKVKEWLATTGYEDNPVTEEQATQNGGWLSEAIDNADLNNRNNRLYSVVAQNAPRFIKEVHEPHRIRNGEFVTSDDENYKDYADTKLSMYNDASTRQNIVNAVRD